MVCKFLECAMQHWRVGLYCADQYYEEVNIRRVIFQGDSLSPLLFVMALMPLSGILNNTGEGFILEKNGLKLNHLDDLKLFSRNNIILESLLHTVKLFSSSICMNFGLDECATTSVVRGKLVESNNVILTKDITTPALDIFDFYKYLGMFENVVTEDSLIKNKVTTNNKERIRKILKSSCNGSNVMVAINT